MGKGEHTRCGIQSAICLSSENIVAGSHNKGGACTKATRFFFDEVKLKDDEDAALTTFQLQALRHVEGEHCNLLQRTCIRFFVSPFRVYFGMISVVRLPTELGPERSCLVCLSLFDDEGGLQLFRLKPLSVLFPWSTHIVWNIVWRRHSFPSWPLF